MQSVQSVEPVLHPPRPQLRIRIPPQKYEEEVGDEYAVFGELCKYIRPYELCGLCNIDNGYLCSICFALHSRKVKNDPKLLNKCLHYFDKWFKTLLLRKEREKNEF
jgi:hypothetical protein